MPIEQFKILQESIKPGGYYPIAIFEAIIIIALGYAIFRVVPHLLRIINKEHEAHREEMQQTILETNKEQREHIRTLLDGHRDHIREILDRYERYIERLLEKVTKE